MLKRLIFTTVASVFLFFLYFVLMSFVGKTAYAVTIWNASQCQVSFLEEDGVTPYPTNSVDPTKDYYIKIVLTPFYPNEFRITDTGGGVLHDLGNKSPLQTQIRNPFPENNPSYLFSIQSRDQQIQCQKSWTNGDFLSVNFSANPGAVFNVSLNPEPPTADVNLVGQVKAIVENGAGKHWVYETWQLASKNLHQEGDIPAGENHWERPFPFPSTDSRAVIKVDGVEKDVTRSIFSLGCGMEITTVDKTEDPDTGAITFTVRIRKNDPAVDPADYYVTFEGGSALNLEPDGSDFKVTIGPIAPEADSKIYEIALKKKTGGADTVCDSESVFVAGNPAAGKPGTNPCPGGSCGTAIGTFSTNPIDFVGQVLTIATGLAGGIAFILMVIGAIRVLTSTGNPQNVNAGRDMIIAALAGLLFIIFSVLILRFIGVNIFGDLNPFT